MNKHNTVRPPEIKAVTGDAQSVAEAFEEFMEAFEAFKETNDERLAQVEARMGEDVVTVEKMNRINHALDQQKTMMDNLVLKGKRPAHIKSTAGSVIDLEHKNAFDAYVRSGREDGLRSFEQKALSYSVDADGGYLVPEETSAEIGKRLATTSPIRSIAGVQTVSSSVYKKPFAVT